MSSNEEPREKPVCVQFPVYIIELAQSNPVEICLSKSTDFNSNGQVHSMNLRFNQSSNNTT